MFDGLPLGDAVVNGIGLMNVLHAPQIMHRRGRAVFFAQDLSNCRQEFGVKHRPLQESLRARFERKVHTSVAVAPGHDNHRD
jgi:hypothetical protein